MTIYEVADQVVALLKSRGRVSYRSLTRESDLDEPTLDDLKEELLFSHPEIVEVDGRGLGWNRAGETQSPPQPAPSPPQARSPSTYRPQHLAERIRAEQQAMESRGTADGERKTITALFTDLKGSTAFIRRLRPRRRSCDHRPRPTDHDGRRASV